MLQFQQKVAALRSFESITYTICLTIVVDEAAACDAAQHVLLRLFKDNEFWDIDESLRRSHIMRHCVEVCLTQVNIASQNTSSSYVS